MKMKRDDQKLLVHVVCKGNQIIVLGHLDVIQEMKEVENLNFNNLLKLLLIFTLKKKLKEQMNI